jgi:hypothetical protein
MSNAQRVFLLLVAAFCGGHLALSGASFSYAVEPDQYSVFTGIFWFFVGAVFSSPMWFPALIPARFIRLSRIFRWTSTFLIFFHTMFFGSIVAHNVNRWLNGLEPSLSSLFAGLVATSGCLAAIALLVWPEVGTYVKRAKGGERGTYIRNWLSKDRDL